ncbi:uncharacterized protein LOC144903844 isoform X2 [Branchiostoma floridae x Branchiostoma belcheri]
MDSKVLKKKWPGRGVSITAVRLAVLVVVLSAILQPSDAQQEDEKSLLALTESDKDGALVHVLPVSPGEKHGDHDSDDEARGVGRHLPELSVIDIGFPQDMVQHMISINPIRVCVRYCSTRRCHGWWSRRRCHVRRYCCRHLFHGWLI